MAETEHELALRYGEKWRAGGGSAKQKLPEQVREKVAMTIGTRIEREIADSGLTRGRRGFTVAIVAALIAIVWQAASAPTNFVYLLLQIGIPGGMWAIFHHMNIEDEKNADIRAGAIRHEEWSAALKSHGIYDELPRDMQS